MTYAELERTANAVGRGLLGLGLQRQEPVGFIMGNSWQFMATYYGCAKAALISLPINLAQVPDEIRFCSRMLPAVRGASLMIRCAWR